MSTGIAAMVSGAAVGRASWIARGVAQVPAANLISFRGTRSGETIVCSAVELEPVALADVEYVLHKMQTGMWSDRTSTEPSSLT